MFIVDSQVHIWAPESPDRPWIEGGAARIKLNGHREKAMGYEELRSLMDEAGEPGADNGGFSGGTRQEHFEVSFDIVSAVPNAEQPGHFPNQRPELYPHSVHAYSSISDLRVN